MTNKYLVTCSDCGGFTSRKYAREHAGHCKSCVELGAKPPTRNERIIDAGYDAYAREEGHYDLPDNY